jgi:hypothetical protein
MSQAITGILKGSQVRLAGRRPAGEPATASGHAGGAACQGVTARIVEQSADQAVVEVLCTCGNVIRLRCACAAPDASANANG